MATRNRSIMKTITFRALATITTMAFVWIFTGSLLLTGVIGGLEIVSKLVIYYLHERLWNRISWGK
jgi:uncharacterized membrane protein